MRWICQRLLDWLLLRLDLKDALSILGVEMIEDDHTVTLRYGDEEQGFSALGATKESLMAAAKEMRAQKRWMRPCQERRGK